MAASSIKLSFLIDKEQKRVVYVKAGSDFVDVIFSFLTLPLGSIVRLLKKQSGLGSLDSLYDSIEQLDAEYLQNEACKEMLLNPRSAAAQLCEDLKIKGIHDLKPRTFYTCSQDDCLIHSACYYTYSSKVLCSRCGKLMDRVWCWSKRTTEDGGVFVKTTTEFMITDDLRVMPASLLKSISLLKEMNIKNTSMLEERVIKFGTKEALKLLERSLVSKKALTKFCFPKACMKRSASSSSLSINEEIVADETQNEIKVELILNKKNNNVLYAEVGDDFINQLFSFLAFPLGSVLKNLSDNMSPLDGCIQNLYSSVETMGLDYFKSEICRNMLLTPKLATFYGYKNQLILGLEEITATRSIINGSCAKCFADNRYKQYASTQCIHGIRLSEYVEQNPKSVKGLLDNGGGFVSAFRRFSIMDNLRISLQSAASAIINDKNLSISDLVGKELSLSKCMARSLLHIMLTTKALLCDVFSSQTKAAKEKENAAIIVID